MLLFTFLLPIIILPFVNVYGQDDLQSPCPRLFVYEAKSAEPGTWYGIVTLLSETDLSGVWLRLVLDKPSLQLGNWFGQVTTNDNKDYLIKNRNNPLKAHTPQSLRFFIRYNPEETAPRLTSFRLNGRTVCPEGGLPETSTAPPELQTSGQLPTATQSPTVERPTFQSGDIFGQGSSDDDEYFKGDLYNLFNRPTSQQTPNINSNDINSVCGTTVIRPRPLITYGQETEDGQYPWHTALYYAKGIELTYICGGSLISRDFVITVAHCVTKRRSASPLNSENLVVYLGKYYLKKFSSTGIQDKQVNEIISHPKYNPNTYSNDIALLKFSSPADFTDYVRPVCLWKDSSDLGSILNRQGSVVGWGFDETGKVTEKLMQAIMPVVSQETCIFSFPDFYSRFTSSTTFCAGFRNGTSVCNGDSGGGMTFPKQVANKRTPVWHIRGLVSISVALQNQFKCDTTHYVIFTDVAKYLDWIKQITNI